MSTSMRTPTALAAAWAVLSSIAFAQVPAAAPATGAAAALSAQEPQGYAYDAAGRRDPFVSLVGRGHGEPTVVAARTKPPGLAGLTTSEVSLRGTLQSRGGYVGIVQGADTKTYIVRPGGKLMDGTIRAITADAMVILQAVEDPLSLEKEREVRKALRQQMEEAK